MRVLVRDLTGGQSLEIWKGALVDRAELAAERFAVARRRTSDRSLVGLAVRRRSTVDYPARRMS